MDQKESKTAAVRVIINDGELCRLRYITRGLEMVCDTHHTSWSVAIAGRLCPATTKLEGENPWTLTKP
jgi:hypothetical protein